MLLVCLVILFWTYEDTRFRWAIGAICAKGLGYIFWTIVWWDLYTEFDFEIGILKEICFVYNIFELLEFKVSFI